MATALDVIGDRWTILILRELLGGAARFNELRDGLPGIAGNLLTERLRRLEADGLVRQMKVHNALMYGLTEQGKDIRTTLEELGMWGARLTRVAPALHERSLRAIAMALQAILVRAGDALPTERFVIELEVEGQFAEVILDQNPSVTVRLSIKPDARVRITHAGISSILMGQQADRSIVTHVSGNEVATQFFIRAIG